MGPWAGVLAHFQRTSQQRCSSLLRDGNVSSEGKGPRASRPCPDRSTVGAPGGSVWLPACTAGIPGFVMVRAPLGPIASQRASALRWMRGPPGALLLHPEHGLWSLLFCLRMLGVTPILQVSDLSLHQVPIGWMGIAGRAPLCTRRVHRVTWLGSFSCSPGLLMEVECHLMY